MFPSPFFSFLFKLDIIDACVSYIESLQHQLHLHSHPGLLPLQRLIGGGEEDSENRLREDAGGKDPARRRPKRRRRRSPSEPQQQVDKVCKRLRS